MLIVLSNSVAQLSTNYLWKVKQKKSESFLPAQVNDHVHNINYKYTNETPTILPVLEGKKPCCASINELMPAVTMRSTSG